MKNIRIIGFMTLLLLCPHIGRAEQQLWAQHDFSDLLEAKNLDFSDHNKVGTTDVLIYTCSGTDAKFAFVTDDYVISLPKNGSTVVISPAINKLARIYIVHYPVSKCTNIKIYVSTDGTNWGEPISGTDINYDFGTIDVTLNRRNYYIKIVNTTTSTFDIHRINYYTEDCNCFPYIPE